MRINSLADETIPSKHRTNALSFFSQFITSFGNDMHGGYMLTLTQLTIQFVESEPFNGH